MVNIAGLDKAEVLLALWKGSHAQGMSFFGLPEITPDVETMQREIELSPDLRFDYLMGHVLKVNISGDEFMPHLYDRDNYEGAAADAIKKLRDAQV